MKGIKLSVFLPLLVNEELFVPPEDVELAEGDVVICCPGLTNIELSPPDEVADASEDSGLRIESLSLPSFCKTKCVMLCITHSVH